jgi:NADH:ubiquinone oxidoreductase subunit 3 (subunit A)
MSMSSHLGIVILVIVGAVTVLGVIIAAIIETRRMDSEKPSTPQQTAVTPTDKKRG